MKYVTTCPECGREHARPRSHYCSTGCQRRWNARQLKEGRKVIALVKGWVAGKGGGHTPAHPLAMEALRDLTQIARSLIDADKAKGRMNPIDYLVILMADGSRWFDRQRS